MLPFIIVIVVCLSCQLHYLLWKLYVSTLVFPSSVTDITVGTCQNLHETLSLYLTQPSIRNACDWFYCSSEWKGRHMYFTWLKVTHTLCLLCAVHLQ